MWNFHNNGIFFYFKIYSAAFYIKMTQIAQHLRKLWFPWSSDIIGWTDSACAIWFRSPVLRGIWILASTHKTWRRLYFFLMFFPYQVIYQKTCQILGFLNIHELVISWNTNLNKRGRIHDIWDHFCPKMSYFSPFLLPKDHIQEKFHHYFYYFFIKH